MFQMYAVLFALGCHVAIVVSLTYLTVTNIIGNAKQDGDLGLI